MFANMLEAERQQRQFQSTVNALARMPENRLRELDLMLNAKRQVNNAVSPTSNVGKFLNTLSPGSARFTQRQINRCLSAIDKTIDNNILSLMGTTADAVGITTLLKIQQTLGRDFIRLTRTLNYANNFGPNAINQLQSAFDKGVRTTIMNALGVATQAVNETINGVVDGVYCAALPSLNELQNQIAGVLGPVSSIAGAVSDLTQQVTNDINKSLRSLQREVDDLSKTISGGLLQYAVTPGTTCANRPDSQLGIREAISSSLGCN